MRAKDLRRRLAYHLLRGDPYAPFPDLRALPDALWARPAPMPGVDLRLDASVDFYADELKPLVEAFEPPDGYRGDNPMYVAGDAEVLYAMVRWARPARVVEVGAGWSTRIIRRALAESGGAEHRVFDPDTRGAAERAGPGSPVEAVAAEDIPSEEFAALAARDILFIDTTHVVRPGGDVTRLILEVLPSLAPGVIVHIHDFFRPFEYPRFLMADHGLFWQEHHLVQAFLAFNSDFEVLLAKHAVDQLRPGRLVPGGCALWLRRI